MSDGSAKVQIVGAPMFMPGLIHGLNMPSLIVVLEEVAERGWPASEDFARIDAVLAKQIPDFEPAQPSARNAADNLQEVARFLAGTLFRIHKALRLPASHPGKVFAARESGGRRQVVVYFPVLPPCSGAVSGIVGWLVRSLNEGGDAPGLGPDELTPLVEALAKAFPGDTATGYFLAAANQLGMPFDWVAADIFQFGHARHSRMMTGTFTDATSRFGAATARHKPLAVQLLRQHGLPVPQHAAVSTVAEGVAAAGKLGYPVVVKPADLDGGLGVSTNLTGPAQVEAAMPMALSHSPNVLVESHVNGKDYRLIVLHGRLIAAAERIPGGVVGDGLRPISALVEEYNRHPMRGEQRHLPLKPLVVDEEALDYLAEQDFSRDGIPEAGQFVRMRGAANVARGGAVRDVTNIVHPDNRRAAERAARALNIDLAGIDFLIDDIAQSWLERGGAICEVNSQPQIGYATTARLYPLILREMVPGQGRVPIVVLYGCETPGETSAALARALARPGFAIGVVNPAGVWVDGARVAPPQGSFYRDGRILLRDRQVAAIILAINDFSVLEAGLPCDAYTLLAIAGDAIEPAPKWASTPSRMVLNAILPGCRGPVLVSSAASVSPADLAGLVPAERCTMVAADKMATTILARLGRH